MPHILPTLLEEFQATLALTKDSVQRHFSFPRAEKMIKVAMGMRRSGKTYFIFQTIRDLVSQGVPTQRILYLNFEDDRLLPMLGKEMGELIDQFYTLFPENHDHCCYLFFDEVQNVENWPLVVRRCFDTKNVQIFLTGSSSKLLSKEIASSLRGRSISLEIWPYNFQEYFTAHQYEAPPQPFGKRSLDKLQSYLTNFLRNGGFPAVQGLAAHEQLVTLQSYVEMVILRDIVERHKIENIALLRYFIGFLLKNIAAPFSIHKFYNDIKSQGYKVAKDTLYNYISHLEDAYLLFMVGMFTESPRLHQTTPKKVYAIDNGLAAANSFNLSSNWGKLFENQLYLDLRRAGNELFYYRTADGYEVDFVVKSIEGKMSLLQVVFDSTDSDTLHREERALRQAEKELAISGELLDWTSYCKNCFPSR